MLLLTGACMRSLSLNMSTIGIKYYFILVGFLFLKVKFSAFVCLIGSCTYSLYCLLLESYMLHSMVAICNFQC